MVGLTNRKSQTWPLGAATSTYEAGYIFGHYTGYICSCATNVAATVATNVAGYK